MKLRHSLPLVVAALAIATASHAEPLSSEGRVVASAPSSGPSDRAELQVERTRPLKLMPASA